MLFPRLSCLTMVLGLWVFDRNNDFLRKTSSFPLKNEFFHNAVFLLQIRLLGMWS